MLGLVPPVLGFVGLPLDVRHVTLSTGQLAAAAGALGPDILKMSAFWWCVAGIACTGVLNLGVSFYLAMKGGAAFAWHTAGGSRARDASHLAKDCENNRAASSCRPSRANNKVAN